MHFLVFVIFSISFYNGTAYTLEEVMVPGQLEEKPALLFLPAGEGPRPAVYYSYTGFRTATPYMISTARYFAGNGIACLVYSGNLFHKKGNTSFIQTSITDGIDAINYLRNHEDIIPDKVGILGHSFGAASAEMVALDFKDINALVILGMIGTSNSQLKTNIMIGVGALDEIRQYNELIESIKLITNDYFTIDNQLYGDIKKRNGRMLAISPFSDHISETYDFVLLESSLLWFSRSFSINHTRISKSITITWSLILRFLLSICLFCIVALGLNHIFLRFRVIKKIERILTFFMFCIFVTLSFFLPYSIIAKNLILSACIGVLAANRIVSKNLIRGLVRFFCTVFVILICILPGLLLNSMQYVFNHPELIFKVLIGLLSQTILIPAVLYENISAILLGGFKPLPVLISPIFYILIIEIFFPGFGSTIKLRGFKLRISQRKKLLVLINLFIILFILFVIRLKQGFLDDYTLNVLKLLFLRVVILPILLFLLVRRTRFWRWLRTLDKESQRRRV